MHEQFEHLKKVVAEMESDVAKFNEKNNKSAGVRVRKSLQEVRNVAQDIRRHILDKRNGRF